MGYDADSVSGDGGDEDSEEEYEDVGGGNRFLGFMFGNVDNSGDLDADYLDEDAKEHLAALADKLGPSLTDMDLSVKSPRRLADVVEQGYDDKAEDAVDYEDIDEQYEGPEVEAASEEDYLLPKKEYFSAKISLANLEPTSSLFDDENYDEDFEMENHTVITNFNAQPISLAGQETEFQVVSGGDTSFIDAQLRESPYNQNLASHTEEFQEEFLQEVPEIQQGALDGRGVTTLPVLCIEDGMVILRFSEIFGVREPSKKVERRDHSYSTHKDRYKSMDVFDFAEEDEEAFLKESGQENLEQGHFKDDISIINVANPEFNTHSILCSGDQMVPHVDEQKKDTCLSEEPMKDGLVENFNVEWKSSLLSKFYPLDQQNWEDRIQWDDSPSSSVNSGGSCKMSEFDLEASLTSEMEPRVGTQSIQLEPCSDPYDRANDFFLCGFPGLLEPFGSRRFSLPANPEILKRSYHPQLLRLESCLEGDVSGHTDTENEIASKELHQSNVIRSYIRHYSQNHEMFEGSWLDKIIWESDGFFEKPKLILDLQDEQMVFEILENKEAKHVGLHAGATIITHISKSARGDSFEPGPGGHSGWTQVANDKHYSIRKTPQQLKSTSKKRAASGVRILHSKPAINLQTMKLKLSNKDLANFHRPKAIWYPHDNEVAVKEQGKLPTQGAMKIIVKSLGGKGSKLHVDAEETLSSFKEKASKKLDFKISETVRLFYLGKELEESKSLSAQNVQPNSLLHLVRSNIHLLPRAQSLPGENKSLRPPGAFKKKSDLSVKDGHVFLMEYCEERPLLLSNVGMAARLCTYYQKSVPDDQTGSLLRNGSNGHVILLDPGDKSPFLGDIKAGSSQSSLETNMYRAPIFLHKVPLTDYLLVRSAKGKLSLRRIDRVHAVGQQEPLMEVITPGSKSLQNYLVNRLYVYACQEFLAAEKCRSLPYIRANELPQLPGLSDTTFRKTLNRLADQRFLKGQSIWIKKPDIRISEADLKRVTPEDVCRYESMQAGLYRLKHLGIMEVHPASILSAMSRLPDEAIALAAASHIERELQITPWNLSSNFVACMNQGKENIERLEITGVGDPSGRGLGFSFVRAVPKAPLSNAMSKKKISAGRGGSTVTGTDADLRRLSMDAAREVLIKFNVSEEQIEKLTRWHRIAMIRKLSSDQAASGMKVDPTTINKYARGQRMSFLQLQQQTRYKCQEIWERQIQSLSTLDGDENDSDSEGNSDLDSFAGDLENLLDAEEFEDEEGSGLDKVESVKGLKMRRRPSFAQAEEEIEDEAAEAAELCRLLMDGNQTARRKKKKKKLIREAARLASGSQPACSENADQIRTIGIKPQPDGSYTSKENICDSKGAENLHIRKEKSGKVKSMKKNDTSPMSLSNKRLKISGDQVKAQSFKEKKSARENFVCGRCGQFGHMRTNKNCPKYGEDIETLDATDQEKALTKLSSLDSSTRSYQKTQTNKPIPKAAVKNAVAEAPESEKSSSIAKALPLKFKCSSADKLSDNLTVASTQSFDLPVNSDHETEKPAAKVNKIKFSNKMKVEDTQIESHRPSIVIRPPTVASRVQIETHKPSIVIRPPANIGRDRLEFPKLSAVMRPPVETEQPHKKIKIKQPKEHLEFDQVGLDGVTGLEHRKTKTMIELSSVEKYGKPESIPLAESFKKKDRRDRKLWEEHEKRKNEKRPREERGGRLYDEEMRIQEEQEKLAEIRRFEATIRREREEEESQKAKKKKKKLDVRDEYIDDPSSKRNDKRILERARNAKRRPIVELGGYGAEYTPATKRRKGGEVGLSNILERIVDTLKDRYEVSYLFLKPVSKKEAPDYLDIVEYPMDLSTVKEKVRKLEYKCREDFRHDVWQITFNAHLYNDGRNPGIPPLADQLLELCDYLLIENDESLTEAEAGIDD